MIASGLFLLLAVGRTWATLEVGGLTSTGSVSVTGRQAAPVVAGLALVVLAAAILVAIGGSRLRGLALVVGAVSGAGLVAAARQFEDDAWHLLAERAGEVTGRAGDTSELHLMATNAWPWVVQAAGALVLVACVAGLTSRRTWSQAGRRFERAPAPAPSPDRPSPDRPSPDRPSPDRPSPDRPGDVLHSPATPHPVDPLDAWQALSRGDDPTLAG